MLSMVMSDYHLVAIIVFKSEGSTQSGHWNAFSLWFTAPFPSSLRLDNLLPSAYQSRESNCDDLPKLDDQKNKDQEQHSQFIIALHHYPHLSPLLITRVLLDEIPVNQMDVLQGLFLSQRFKHRLDVWVNIMLFL